MADIVESSIPPELENVIRACITHAEDLLRASRRILQDENLPHVAYHLATLALEEVGKAEINAAGHMALSKDEFVAWPGKHSDDHVKKLFWVLWTPSFGNNVITKDHMESLQGLAKAIHQKRLQGIYVDTFGTSSLPQHAVDKTEAENIISLTSARIELVKGFKSRTLNELV